jgi:glucan phosphoethanolaminetransferase (alkaline phosphatase superfamily)
MKKNVSPFTIAMLLLVGTRFGLKEAFIALNERQQTEIVKCHPKYILIIIFLIISLLLLILSISFIWIFTIPIVLILLVDLIGNIQNIDKENHELRMSQRAIMRELKEERKAIRIQETIKKWKG